MDIIRYRAANFRCIWNGFTHELCINILYFCFAIFVGSLVSACICMNSDLSPNIEFQPWYTSCRHWHRHRHTHSAYGLLIFFLSLLGLFPFFMARHDFRLVFWRERARDRETVYNTITVYASAMIWHMPRWRPIEIH